LPGVVLTAAVAVSLSRFGVDEALALGTLQHPSVEESATGARGILSLDLPRTARGSHVQRVWLEASEFSLYGITGLHLSGLRAGARFGSVRLDGAASQLASDIGRETRLALTPAYCAGDRWAASLGVVHESASVDGFATARLSSVTVRSRVRLSKSVSIGGEIDRCRLSGEPSHGVDATLVAVMRPASAAVIYAVCAFDRRTGLHPSVAMTFAGGNVFRLTLGYEGTTDALKGAVAVEVGGLVCAAGVDYHPVLGSRRGITVAWRR
jgi:hypothetical protein